MNSHLNYLPCMGTHLNNAFTKSHTTFRFKIASLFTVLLWIMFFSTNVLAQDNLVGLTSNGGPQGKGTLFSIKTTGGTTFSILKALPDWGKYPYGNLIQGPDGSYYGMSYGGGTFVNYGTIFKITSTGVLTVLHQFNYTTDGGYPFGSLTLGKDGNFYGLTSGGGTNTYGTIFKMTPAGVFTVLRNFNITTDGSNPRGQMVQDLKGDFYGITYHGGKFGYGTIFRFRLPGTLDTLKSFNGTTDGGVSLGSIMIAKDSNIYGFTYSGGIYNNGTIFRISRTGTFKVIHNLKVTTDGGFPRSTPVQAPDGYLYGTCYNGGVNSEGTIFKINPTDTTFQVLRNLNCGPDGCNPYGSLIVGADGLLYGMCASSGAHGGGTIFRISTTGATFTVLRALTAVTDGGVPYGSLFKSSDGNYYGMANSGGNLNFGTVFRIKDTVFKVLTNFNGSYTTGNAPFESLVQGKDNAYYGTTNTGGKYNFGTVFKLCGGTYTVLHSFNLNPEGGYPEGSLIQATDGNYYGLTSSGGTGGNTGTIFKITPTGVFTVIHAFANTSTNKEGNNPKGSLIQGTDGYLYGMTNGGGTNASGTIFKIATTGGTTFKVIRQLVYSSDGGSPQGSLIKGLDSNFYGMTTTGGAKNAGTIFKISPNGVIFTVIRTLTTATDGSNPSGSLFLAKDSLFYGTANFGGTFGGGTIFKINSTGTVFNVLKHFNPAATDSNGYNPKGNLIQASDGNFYGLTSSDGKKKAGVIFRISPTGTFAVIRHLDLIADGGTPLGSLIIQKTLPLVANPQKDTTKEDVAKAIVLTGSGGSPLTFTITTQPKNGTITSGTSANRTYTPKANYNGKDSFYFTANVGCLSSPPAKVFILITPVNDTPVLAPIGNKSVKVNTLLTFTATATDVDTGQAKTFSLIGAPSGATIVVSTGVFKWTPTTTGSFTFKVRVTDNGSPVLFDEEQITVTVTATAPVTTYTMATMQSEKRNLINSTSNPQIYPNPVTDKFVVVLNEHLVKPSATIIDTKGSLINKWSYLNVGGTKLEFDISNLSSGQYILQLKSGDKKWVFKFLKL
jgi:uncharacterized repeat protein (TIGR03803 family)